MKFSLKKKKRKDSRVSNFLHLANMNAKHPRWGDKNNAQQEFFNDFLQQEDLIALNDGEPTFTFTNRKSAIDLVICNANLDRHFCGLATDYNTKMFTGAPNRSHYPVTGTFDIVGNSRSTHVKDLKKTDWDKWRETLESCLQSPWLEIDECCDAKGSRGILPQCSSSQLHFTSQANQFTLEAILQ